MTDHLSIIADSISVLNGSICENSLPYNYTIRKCCGDQRRTYKILYENTPVIFVKLIEKKQREFEILLKLSPLPKNRLIEYKTSPNILRESIESTDTEAFEVHNVQDEENFIAVIMPWAVDCKQLVIDNNRNNAKLRKKVFIGIIDVILDLWKYGLYYLDIKPENFLYYKGQVLGADFGSICTEDIINKGQFEGQWPVTHNIISDKGIPNIPSSFFIMLVFHLLKTWSDIYFPTDKIAFNAMGISMANATSLEEKLHNTIELSANIPGVHAKGYSTWHELIIELINWIEPSRENDSTTICSESNKAKQMIMELREAMVAEVRSNIPQRPVGGKGRGINPRESNIRTEKHKLSLKF